MPRVLANTGSTIAQGAQTGIAAHRAALNAEIQPLRVEAALTSAKAAKQQADYRAGKGHDIRQDELDQRIKDHSLSLQKFNRLDVNDQDRMLNSMMSKLDFRAQGPLRQQLESMRDPRTRRFNITPQFWEATQQHFVAAGKKSARLKRQEESLLAGQKSSARTRYRLAAEERAGAKKKKKKFDVVLRAMTNALVKFSPQALQDNKLKIASKIAQLQRGDRFADVTIWEDALDKLDRLITDSAFATGEAVEEVTRIRNLMTTAFDFADAVDLQGQKMGRRASSIVEKVAPLPVVPAEKSNYPANYERSGDGEE